MNKSIRFAFLSQSLAAALAGSIFLAAPAGATPIKPSALDDRIRAICEASTVDIAGRRAERQCRAEWQERVRQLEAQHGRGRVVIQLR